MDVTPKDAPNQFDPLGQFIGIGSEKTDKGTTFFGERDPVTGQRQERFAPSQVAPTATSVIGIDQSANEISQGTDDIRDEGTLLNNQINQMVQGANDGIDTSKVDIGAEFEILKTQAANLGVISEAELTEIEEAGVAAGAEFDPLIAEARERARLGQAANIVATGRRGGFQRARYAGQAALGPTIGDVGYADVGGVLERTESAFQRNIDALNSQKTRAIALAKAQARTAIRTGKESDFNAAKSILEFARQMDTDAKKAEQDMFDNLFKLKQEARAEGAEARQRISATFNIVKDIPEGTTVTIEGFDFQGIAVPDAEKDFFSGSNLISLMGQLQVGTSQIITDPNTGREYEIFGTKDPATVEAFDDQGNLSVIDKFTGNVISKAEGGGKSKTLPTSIVINSETGLNPTQTTQARANYLKNNAGKTINDFESLSPSEKLTWYGGGPQLSDLEKELADVINKQKDFLASDKGNWEVAYNTLIGRDKSLGEKLTQVDKDLIYQQTGISYGPEYETMADIILDKPNYYTK